MINKKTFGICILSGLLIMMIGAFFGTEPSSAAAKVGKVTGSGTYFICGEQYEFNTPSQLYWNEARGAKKYQIYQSKKLNKGYKKLKTCKIGRQGYTMDIEAPEGLVCYKVRGVRGTKKGKFSPPAIAYGFDVSVEDVQIPSGFNGTVFTIRVDNTAENSRDLTFFNPKWKMTYYTNNCDTGDEFEEATGYFSDPAGAKAGKTTVKRHQTGYIYYAVKSKNAKSFYEMAMDSGLNVDLSLEFSFYIKIGKHNKHFANEGLDVYRGTTNIQGEYAKNLW